MHACMHSPTAEWASLAHDDDAAVPDAWPTARSGSERLQIQMREQGCGGRELLRTEVGSLGSDYGLGT